MVDGLHGLGHHAVVGGYHQDRNIRRIGSAHTHSRKCLVSRRIQEGNLLTVNSYHISADVLRDSACLPVNHMGIADGVQKGGFAVVYMTHYTDYRRTGNETVRCVLHILKHLADHIPPERDRSSSP